MIGGASSSSEVLSPEKYEVFLSFRGEDTRKNFTSHLDDALTRKQIKTFIDDKELRKGDELSSAFNKAIEESHASIVIFSKNYANSTWCLNELIKILECKENRGQIVIPVFHNIDPSHVRKQTGSYEQAFVKHEQDLKLDKDKLQKWKSALTDAANLSGWDSQTYDGTESDLIKAIVEDVLQKLKHRYPYEVKEGLVGIEEKCKEIIELLSGSNDVRIVGIWGMGGIGKTTLAEALCAKLCSQFEGYCFLKNVREESRNHGLDVLRHRLLSALLEEKNLRLDAPYVETNSIMRRLAHKKVFVVLDDVATLDHLFINKNCLGPGSRVIVTTRDKQMCSQFDGCEIYEVKGLKEHDSLQLFCLYAFKEKHPKNGYEELSKCVIGYCKDIPLALKVLGANLRTRSKDAWKSQLKKLRKIPNEEIHKVLKLSYDDLDRDQKNIFIDIACSLFNGTSYAFRDRVIRLYEACGFSAACDIQVLLEKSLITISQHYDQIQMHDLLREMGREIVNQESKDPGKRSRLWKAEEVYDVLKNNKGTEEVEVISFNVKKVGHLYLSSDSFERMTNLRYLEIYKNEENKVHLPDGLGWLSDKLRYLHWPVFPLESLPSTFRPDMLVELRMPYSKLKKLWDGVKKVSNLKMIDLRGSRDLIEVPDLSEAINLKNVWLKECVSLRELHPSILSLPKLKNVNLKGCRKIESLKSNFHCRDGFIKCLDLSGCKKLNITGMGLSNGPGLRSLTTLNLSGCTQINALNLWLILDGIRSLERLYLRWCCNLEALPENIQNRSMLEWLHLDECRKLVFSLTELPPSLKHLTAVNCTYLDKDSTQCPVLENVLQTMSKIPRDEYDNQLRKTFLFLPGGQFPGKFDVQKLKSIPKSDDLCGFVFCIILSEGSNIFMRCNIGCSIYAGGKEVNSRFIIDPYNFPSYGKLISDHVILSCYFFNKEQSGSDLYNGQSFEFKLQVQDAYNKEPSSTEGIKGCGVLPLYALERGSELDGNSSRQEIVEESSASAQVFDIGDSQPTAIGGPEEVGGSTNENEHDQQNLNEQCCRNCSIGLLLKRLLGRVKTIIQVK